VDESPRGFRSEDEEATYCLSLLRDGDRTQKIVARERLSQIFERRGLLDEAAQCLETNVREGVRDPRLYQRLAGVYRRQGRHELADEVLVEARRLAERTANRPPGPRPIRGGRPPGPRRPEPPPHPLEAPTSPMPATGPAESVPAPPLRSAADTAPGELSLDLPPPLLPDAAEERPTAVARPWWLSPPAIILGLLLCGPFGAFVLAAMWVRGGYTPRARYTAIAVWAGLMVLQITAVAVTAQATVASLLGDTTRFAPGPSVAVPTQIAFTTPAPSGPPPAAVAAKPAAAPSPPAVALSPGALGPTPSPASISPSQPTLVPATSQTPRAEERVRVASAGGATVNMRERPALDAPVVKSVADGTVLIVIGPDQQAAGRSWRNVQAEDGAKGWIAADLLEAAQ